MAGIDIGSHGSKRVLDHQIPLIPFIDFLLCLVSFLLMTAVWSQMSRIEADARVPSSEQGPEPKKERQLHVEMKGDSTFRVIWREGNQVVDSVEVPRAQGAMGEAGVQYPELARVIGEQWSRYEGRHYSANDQERDRAVVHTNDTARFEEVVAMIDAVQAQKRPLSDGKGERQVPAFDVALAGY